LAEKWKNIYCIKIVTATWKRKAGCASFIHTSRAITWRVDKTILLANHHEKFKGGGKYGKPKVFRAFAGMLWNSRKAVLSTAIYGGL
jgi:hypothetical protein